MLKQIIFNILLLIFLFASVAQATKSDPVTHFDIKGYKVEGNTLLSKEKINSVLAPFTGKKKDFGTVREAIAALKKAYRDRGYLVKVALPEQDLDNGIVHFKIIETRINKIKTEGNRFFDESNIRLSLPSLQEGQPPDLNFISRSLSVANENPARKISLQLQSNSDKENEVDAVLQVADEKPWKAGVTFDNTGDSNTGRFRIGTLFQHANLFNRDHLVTLQYITSASQPDHVSIYGMGYRIPFYLTGSSIDLIGVYSDVNSGTLSVASNAMQVSGKGSIVGLHYNQNLTRIGKYEHKLTLGLDYRAYVNSVLFGSTQLGNNVTVHPLSLTYAGKWALDRANAGFYLSAIRNLPGLGEGFRDTTDYFNRVRTGAPVGYNILRFGANYLHKFGSDWQAGVLFNGQYTNSPLVPGEQFGIGGASSVRGFDERIIAYDRGYAGSFELYTPNLASLARLSTINCRGLLFYDIGYASRINPLPGETRSSTISSVGPGLRLSNDRNFSVSTDYGFVVDPLAGLKSKWSGRWHMMLSLMY
ncbi:MAG: ShlB/FhaC/HecB family hemolysin secretion/activation protein [Nitrospirae bacterium]|nr:ShlB/FhaC/HecB family hemolysin secretion/activation protein [Nitrospirota bacterium]